MSDGIDASRSQGRLQRAAWSGTLGAACAALRTSPGDPAGFQGPEPRGQRLPISFQGPEPRGQSLPITFQGPELRGQHLPIDFQEPEHDKQRLPTAFDRLNQPGARAEAGDVAHDRNSRPLGGAGGADAAECSSE